MVAALWSNPNWDEEKNSRSNAISELEESFTEAVEVVETAISGKVSEEEQLDKDNPFFSAAERGVSKVEKKYGHLTEGTKEEIDYLSKLDQG